MKYLILLLFPSLIFANSVKGINKDSNFYKNNKQLSIVGLTNADNLIPNGLQVNKIKLTAKEKQQAQVWQLSEQQEKRFIALMQGRMGTYYKGSKLSPVQVLGLSASTDQERTQYAELYATQKKQKIGRELAWSNVEAIEYAKAVKGLPVLRVFDYAKFSPYNQKPVNIESGDVINLVLQKGEASRHIMQYFLRILGKEPNFKLNIYIKGMSLNELEQWAKHQGIPVTWVNKGIISINNKGAIFTKVTSFPSAYLIHGLGKNKTVSSINMSKF